MGEGFQGNRKVPRKDRLLKEGGPWGKHGVPHESEAEPSDHPEYANVETNAQFPSSSHSNGSAATASRSA